MNRQKLEEQIREILIVAGFGPDLPIDNIMSAVDTAVDEVVGHQEPIFVSDKATPAEREETISQRARNKLRSQQRIAWRWGEE